MIELKVPASKSLTQRALLLAALARGESLIRAPLVCDDSATLCAALEQMGATISAEAQEWRVSCPELRFPRQAVYCGAAGTTARFLAALPLVIEGRLTLDGDARLRERPFAPLTDALTALGVEVSFGGRAGFLPFSLCRTAAAPASIEVDASSSSQFASALLMVAPLLPRGLSVRLAGHVVSRPYLELTADVMRAFGVSVSRPDGRSFAMTAASYRPTTHEIEGDWSAAAFLLVASRLLSVPLAISNLRSDSRQPDRAIVAALEHLAEPGPHRIDLTDAPDLIGPLTTAALFADGATHLCGLAHARLKESDRPAVLKRELARIGARIEEHPDGLTITPAALKGPARLQPEGDHRMAMTFGVVALKVAGVEIDERDCVRKSFPDFWELLARLT